jgi:arsenate reductase
MAEGFAREFGDAFLDVYSAGVRPTGTVSDEAIFVMNEKGIDISRHYSKGLDDVPVDDMDYVVSLTNLPAKDMCPPSFAGRTIDWDIEDPIGKPFDQFRITRDDLEERVKELVKQIWQQSGEVEEE